MRAVAYQRSLPATHEESLVDIELPPPVPGARELLVEVRAVAVNPVDTKIRHRAQPPEGEWTVLGFDASGVVVASGADCQLFSPGDEVFYAGAPPRAGSNSELQVVDERIVGHKPRTLDFAAAAAMPLTSLTAWELLFDRLQVPRASDQQDAAVLVVGAAGGVGSIAVQLLRQLTGFTVVGTASRQETREWVMEMGAHVVVDHARSLAAEVAAHVSVPIRFVVSTVGTDQHWSNLVELLAPQGRIGLIDDPAPIDVRLLKQKSASLHWEYMPTRPINDTPDVQRQHEILEELSSLVDDGVLRSTQTETFGPINAENLRRAHTQIETGTTRGKIVLSGWPD